MNTIAGLNTIIHSLRGKRAGTSRKAESSSAPPSRPMPRASETEIRSALAARLGALDPDQPDMQERAVDIFIETALHREFGALVLEPESWRDLLIRVREAMLSTPQSRNAVLQMLQAVRLSAKG